MYAPPDDVIASQFDAVTTAAEGCDALAAAEGCDALVATGVMPTAAEARSVAEKLGIRSVSVTFQQLILPPQHHLPPAYARRSGSGTPPPADSAPS